MNSEDAKRKLTAILSADVQGYSRLMGDDEQATVEAITAYRKIMTDLISGHHGRVVDAKGDNVLAEFSSVVDAIQAAVEIQKQLKLKNAGLPENRRMAFRIGVNLGDVIEKGDTIYGDGVNIAARLESLADGGGICISGTAFDQVGKKLPLGYKYLGEQKVKNIEKPIRTYKVLLEPEAAGKVIGEHRRLKLWHWTAIFGLIVLVVVAGSLTFWELYVRPDVAPASIEKMAYPLPDKPSIAVLPFRNMTGDERQDLFCDGLTESLMMALSKIPQLFVIAQHSIFSYKGKPVEVRQVSEELGVQYVLEGSVQKANEHVRVTVQLIDALKGHQLWAERFDRKFKDFFSLLDDITKRIITSLQVELTTGESARVYARGTENLDAYLKASEALWNLTRGSKEGLTKANRLAEEAIALDPKFPTAYFVLGSTHMMSALTGFSSNPKASLEKATELLKEAIKLDGFLAIAHATLGYTLAMLKDYDAAVAQSEKAYALAPNSSHVLFLYGTILLTVGKYQEAVSPLEEALRLEPIPPNSRLRSLGCLYGWGLGQYQKAIEYMERAVQREPKDILSWIILTSLYSMANREEDARESAGEVLKINAKFSINKYILAISFKDSATKTRIAQALRKAGLPENPSLPLPDKPSIAVLPFVNMSDDPEQEYFSDGISEDIITALSKTSKLFVIARTSSFRYKGKEKDIRQIGRELGVRYVLEGSVRRSGDSLRITAQLIDTKTGNHLWGHRYERGLKDVFALQDEITMKIITSLQVTLTEGEQARLLTKRIGDLNLYFKSLELRSLWDKGTKESHIRFGQIAQEVIDMAPDSEVGYRSLAWHYWWLAAMGKSPKESFSKAFKLAQKALSMDNSDPFVHCLLGTLYLYMRQYEKAIAAGKRSVELEPNGAMVHGLLGMTLSFAGRPDEAIAHLKEGIRLNPFPPYWYFMRLGQAYTQKGEYEKALSQYKNAIKCSPDAVAPRAHLAGVYVLLGRQEEAGNEAKKVLELHPDFSMEQIAKSLPFKDEAYLKTFVEAIQKAGLK